MTPGMLNVRRAADLGPLAGSRLGQSQWLVIEQAMIDSFAALTGDAHWIHIDAGRAANEMPGGRTIAHGLFLLSLIPGLHRQIYAIAERGAGLNYGYDRIRFTAPVPVGSRIRLVLALVSAEPHRLGTTLVTDATIEIEGAEKPALIARNILLVKDESDDR